LSQVAASLLVLVDGQSTLRDIRALAPQLSDIEFGILIRDAHRRGVLTF
jgi:hypothetical protein